ncbi:hypothetical protein CLV30_106217 [Haloactinopolyspora alba]|uniref:UPF0235 protein CLV30_106217 n=1 Tax=Haloactinopolyspora alba TaxID=648780 RepID=A0A2P8E411_9ACTN|nr:DUF167 domain-containing protein [Haloactinopolyspora alba]PSL04212.1 hypothetical protein CLV30_106217 [Haloactinopolyspora alba]
MRVTIRVKPGSARPRVGGRYGEALVVAVSPRAVDGQATRAALDALAGAVGCRRREVILLTGSNSRTKIVQVPDVYSARVTELMEPGD